MVSLGPDINFALIAWIVAAFLASQGLGLACLVMGILLKKYRLKLALVLFKIGFGLGVVAITVSAGAVATRISQGGKFPIQSSVDFFIIAGWFGVPTVVAASCWFFWRRGQQRYRGA